MVDLGGLDLDNFDFGSLSFFLADTEFKRPSLWSAMWNFLPSLSHHFLLFFLWPLITLVRLQSLLFTCASAGLVLLTSQALLQDLASVLGKALPPCSAWVSFLAHSPALLWRSASWNVDTRRGDLYIHQKQLIINPRS